MTSGHDPPVVMRTGAWAGRATLRIIVPREWNYLMNIYHPAFKGVAITARQLDFDLDTRLV